MKKIAFIFLFIAGLSIQLLGAVLSGKVTDQAGEPLPFATLYILNTTIGTTTNLDGQYQLTLSPGQYELVYQYVGYKKQQISLAVDHRNILLHVVLEPEVLQLNEIVISADGPDPAYAVIKAAIAKRKFHSQEVEAFRCRVYVKGLQTLDEKPDQVLGMNIPLDTGVIYLSESISELSFARPDRIKEVMISSKVSGKSTAFSFNQGSEMMFSFYDNLLSFPGLSERGFVSPIANNALMFYTYELQGTMVENGLLINKIKVIPKRKNDPVFSGYIYILEDTWRVHSVDLQLTKEHQIEFIDDLNIHQVYTPVSNGIWMVFSQKFSFRLNVFGFRGDGNFVSIQTNYELQPNYAVHPVPEELQKQLFPPGYFTNELMKIESEANKRDAQYWDLIRPMPLTEIETVDYQVKDSLEVVVASRPYKDSIDRVVNKFNLETLVIGGYFHQRSHKELYFRLQPIYNILQFNTVEGLVANVHAVITKEKDGIRKYQFVPTIRYGFASEDFYAKAKFGYQFNSIKRTRLIVEGGKFVQGLNESVISPLINSYETLINRRNYLKLYEKSYGKIRWESEITNGVHLVANVEYAQRNELLNTSDYSFFYEDERDFTSNAPDNIELDNTAIGTTKALVVEAKFFIKFKQSYISHPNKKYNTGSKYPGLFLFYRKGIPILGSEVDFDEIWGRVYKEMSYGLVGTSNYTIWAGTFLNDSKLTFADYRHQHGNRSIFANFDNDNFQMLDYYQFSTSKAWIAGHIDHHFNGFIMNKLPLFRKSKAQVVITGGYLKTSVSGHFLEYGIGLEHIFKVARLDYYGASIDGQSYSHGIRLGLGF